MTEAVHPLLANYLNSLRALRRFTELRKPDPQIRSSNLDHIRLADEADEEQIFFLCRLMHEEGGFHELNTTKMAAKIRRATRRESGIIGVIGERHDIQAMIFLDFERPWYSDEVFLQEYFCYVRPDSRNSLYSRDLIAYAKRTADQLQVDVLIGVLSNIRTEGKCRLYRRWLTKVGEFYLYRPPIKANQTVGLAEARPANNVAAE